MEPPGSAPAVGERAHVLAVVGGVTVEQVLSGRLGSPLDFDQDHDEWFVVLAGAAVLEVEGERLDLGAGDHLFLPAHAAHRLVETQPGTSWLTLHGPPDGHRPPTPSGHQAAGQAPSATPLPAGTPAGGGEAPQQSTTSRAGTT